MARYVRIAVAVAPLMLLACSSTRVLNSWKEPSFAGPPLRNVFVVSMMASEVARRGSEDAFVAALTGHGVAATPSHSLFPGSLPEEEALRRRIERAGFDGILLVTPGGAETKTTWVPPRTTVIGVGHVGFWGHYHTHWGVAVRPGHRVRERIVRVETTVWKLAGEGLLIWGASTETSNPSSRGELSAEVSEAIVDELAADKVI